MKPNKFIYFLKPKGMKGPIKIGCSRLPQHRLEAMVRWSPFPLELMGWVQGTSRDEIYLHRCFARDHTHHEWFNWSDHLIATIDRVRAIGYVPRDIADVVAVRRLVVSRPRLVEPAPEQKRGAA